jgi:isoaspartyl peptidase/L-asparaginase-like protein (Ntn-hydrolase superfamily)
MYTELLLSLFQTEHVLLVGKGANQFAEEMGIKEIPVSQLVTEEARREFNCYKQYGNAVEELFGRKSVYI